MIDYEVLISAYWTGVRGDEFMSSLTLNSGKKEVQDEKMNQDTKTYSARFPWVFGRKMSLKISPMVKPYGFPSIKFLILLNMQRRQQNLPAVFIYSILSSKLAGL